MKSHGITMEGKFVNEVVDTLPAWTPADEGREIYVLDEQKRYFADGTSWVDYSTQGISGTSGTSGSSGVSGTSGSSGISGTSGSSGVSGTSGSSGESGTSGSSGTSGGTDIVNDTSPQLGGDLDANSHAMVAADHGTATSPQVINVVYGTGSPPAASSTTEGTIFIQYTA